MFCQQRLNNQKCGNHENINQTSCEYWYSHKTNPVAWKDVISTRNSGRNKYEFTEKQDNSVVISDKQFLVQQQNNSHVSNKKMILNHQPKYTELKERDNPVVLTAFPTEKTGKDGGVIFPRGFIMFMPLFLHLSFILLLRSERSKRAATQI